MSKYVLITGASRGLGLSLSRDFADAGYNVISCFRKSSAGLVNLKNAYRNLYLVKMDVSSESSVKRACKKVLRISQKIDILINNAAIYLEDKTASITEINVKDALKTVNVNSIGVLRVLKYFYPLVERSDEKLIINISSEAGSISDCWRDREFGYCMSKAALNMTTKILFNYSISKGVKVVSIHPGWMKTKMGGMNADIYPEEASEGIINLCRKLTLDDVRMNQFYDYKGNVMRW